MAEGQVQSGAEALSISDSAVRRLNQLFAEESRSGRMLRLAISGGGCAGFQYHFEFDDKVGEDDVTIERDGVRVVIDATSLELVRGAEIDFVEDLLGSYFQVNNPNATSSCGCGSSFSL